MRIAVLWVVLVTAAGVFVAMLDAARRHRAHATTLVQPSATEYVWVVIPWLIVALCVAPAVHRVLAAGEGTMCLSCQLADRMAQFRASAVARLPARHCDVTALPHGGSLDRAGAMPCVTAIAAGTATFIKSRRL